MVHIQISYKRSPSMLFLLLYALNAGKIIITPTMVILTKVKDMKSLKMKFPMDVLTSALFHNKAEDFVM